jgi:hypothetical protein
MQTVTDALTTEASLPSTTETAESTTTEALTTEASLPSDSPLLTLRAVETSAQDQVSIGAWASPLTTWR